MTHAVYRHARAAQTIAAQYADVLKQWPVARTERHVPTRQGSTFVIICGPETGPPAVLLHGAQAAFAGTSLGGWLALDYASRRPGVVTAGPDRRVPRAKTLSRRDSPSMRPGAGSCHAVSPRATAEDGQVPS